jgi:hypothetical protein
MDDVEKERLPCDRQPKRARVTTKSIVRYQYNPSPGSRSTLVAEDRPAGSPSDRVFLYVVARLLAATHARDRGELDGIRFTGRCLAVEIDNVCTELALGSTTPKPQSPRL